MWLASITSIFQGFSEVKTLPKEIILIAYVGLSKESLVREPLHKLTITTLQLGIGPEAQTEKDKK